MDQRPEYLDSLEKDIRMFMPAIKETSETIVSDEISDYPVFIAHKGFFPLGEKILDRDELEAEWSVNASTAEELIQGGVIPVDKARFFISQYKPAAEYICLFVVPDETQANFIFVPYS